MARFGGLCRSLGRLAHLTRLHQTAATPGMLDVCIIDPLLVLEPERLATAAAAVAAGGADPAAVQPYITVSLPFRLLAQLPKGRLELAAHDDPGNHWHFGQEGELFQHQFAGRHAVQSGFTSLILAHELQQLTGGGGGGSGGGCSHGDAGHQHQHQHQRHNRKQAGLEEPSWLAFLQHVKNSSGEGLWPTPALPFLFAGKALDCASVGVYTLDQGSGMAGLMLSTEYDTPGAE